MLDTLKTLCTLDGVSGWEDSVSNFIFNEAGKYADEISRDSIGNIFVFKKGKKTTAKPLMVCAHMDEVGLIVKSITDDGYLKFGFIGGVDRRVVIGKRVKVCGKYPGVVGIKAVHLSTKDERKNVPKTQDLYIDIGAKDKEDAEKLVSPGDYAVFDSEFTVFGDGYVKARALDDRIGCAIMLTLLKEDLAFDTHFVFTVQEEVGLRGATVATYRINPHSALVIEGTTAADIPEMKGAMQVCNLGAGPVIGCMDRSTIYDKEYLAKLFSLAEGAGISCQTKKLIAGGTDAGVIHKTARGVRTTSISAPVRYIHSPSSVVCISDVEDMLKLARLFIENWEV